MTTEPTPDPEQPEDHDHVEPALNVDAIVSAAHETRRAVRTRQRLLILAVPTAVTIVWLIAVTATGTWERVLDRWVASVTMVAGSFVAGSTPQGSGAVAYPVFTKILAIPSEVARTFALSIQTIGMGTGAAAILLARRRIDRRAAAIALPAALVGLLGGILLLSDTSRPFAPSLLPGPYVRVTFTVLVAAMAVVVGLQFRSRLRMIRRGVPQDNVRVVGSLILFGLLGGLVSSQVGSGADVLMYALVVALLGVDPRIGVATSVLIMASVSAVGLLVLGILNGQLFTVLTGDGMAVATVSGAAVSLVGGVPAFSDSGTALPAARYDLLGLWVASVPIATWAVPAGAWFASKVRARTLVRFVLVLALLELGTTVIFLDDLRTDWMLTTYLVVGLAGISALLLWLGARRRQIFGLEGATPDMSFTPEDVEAELGFERLLDPDEEDEQ